jgi:two-component system response regulator NreC
MSKLRTLIVDDHAIVRVGIRSLLEGDTSIEVIGEAENGEEAIKKVKELVPELVLMDLAMPEMNGIDATRRIKEEFPDVHVLVLTMHDDEEFFLPVLKAGASGYVVKESEPQELLHAIKVVRSGDVFLSPAVAKSILAILFESTSKEKREEYNKLTNREREVSQMIAAGHTNRQIAEMLFLSMRTVEKHRQSILRKLGLSDREQLAKFAVRKGLIDFEQ